MILGGAPVPGKQFMETALGDVGDARENVGEPGLRINVVELRCGDEAEHEGGALPAAVRTGEEPRFSAQGHRPFILPMSAKSGKFTILGTPISGGKSVYGG